MEANMSERILSMRQFVGPDVPESVLLQHLLAAGGNVQNAVNRCARRAAVRDTRARL